MVQLDPAVVITLCANDREEQIAEEEEHGGTGRLAASTPYNDTGSH